jgi:hypothetical protein
MLNLSRQSFGKSIMLYEKGKYEVDGYPIYLLFEKLLFFLDNGKIALNPVLALKEATTLMALTSMKVTT